MSKGRIQSISEPKRIAWIYKILPSFICIIEYLVVVSLLLLNVVLNAYGEIGVLGLVALIVGVLMIPFWHKTFFDPHFVGADRPLYVEWSDESVSLTGAYFSVEFSVEDILRFDIYGLRFFNQAYLIRIKFRSSGGKVCSMYISPTMRDKKRLLAFLEEQKR